MKKLVIAAAVFAMAVASQAASIAWSMNGFGLKDTDGSLVSLPTGTSLVLVVMNSATGWDSATVIPTGTGSGTTTLAINGTTGRVTGKATFTWSDGGENMIDNGQFLGLMFQDAEGLHQLTYTDGANKGALVDAVYAVSGIASNASALSSKKIMATGNFNAISEVVPEPTSGLLMLLGMAGLALRRRRA